MNPILSPFSGSPLGTPAHYNGMIFGNHFAAQADCEGALAVQGIATLGSPWHGYDVGAAGVPGWESVIIGHYENPENYPSFLLGGRVSENSLSSRVYSGPVVLKHSYKDAYEAGDFHFDTEALRYEEDAAVDAFFTAAKNAIARTEQLLLAGTHNKITLGDLTQLPFLEQSLYQNETLDTDKKLLFYTIDCDSEAEISIGEIALGDYVLAYDAVIISAPAKKITFKNGAMLYDGNIINTSIPRIYEGNKLLSTLASKIIFNFPHAEEVTLETYGFVGSLLATNAPIDGTGGSINGMLAAGSVNQNQGMELHAFPVALGDILWTLEEKPQKTTLTIEKKDRKTAEALENAAFSLYHYNKDTGETVWQADGTTNKQGRLVFADLPFGWYKLTETCPPPSYCLQEDPNWIFELANTNQGEENQMDTLYIENDLARYDICFFKTDCDNNHIKLQGAVFSLYCYNEATHHYDLIEAGLTSNGQGILQIDNLLPGKYRLTETTAPNGYYLPEHFNTDFEVKDNGTTIPPEIDGEIKIENQRLAAVTLCKHDAKNQAILLQGAVYTLYCYNHQTAEYEVVSTGHTTDIHGKFTITGLHPGEYKLVETAAPTGYYLEPGCESLFSVTVDIRGRLIDPEEINAENKKLGEIQIYKIDAADHEKHLQGAEFTLYKFNIADSTYHVYRTGLVTGTYGGLRINDLPPGSYKLAETKAPTGYSLPANPDTLFTITL